MVGKALKPKQQEFVRQLFTRLVSEYKARGMNQTALAKLLDMDQTSVSRAANLGNVTSEALMRAAKLGNVPRATVLSLLEMDDDGDWSDSPYENAKRIFLDDAAYRDESKLAEQFLADFEKGQFSQMPSLGPGQWYEELRKDFDGWRKYAPKGRKL